MKIFKVYCLLLLVMIAFSANGQEDQFEKTASWQDLFVKAKKEHKMVFIDSYFVGCHPCKQMDDEVFPLPNISKLMSDHFISVRIDFLKENLGKQLQVKYAVTGFPTFLLLNSDGQLVSRFSGYKEADKFEGLLKEALVNAKKGNIMKGFSPDLTVNYPEFYTEMFASRKSIDPAVSASYLTGKDFTVEGDGIPMLMTRTLSPELTATFLKNYEQLQQLYGKDLVWSKRISIMAAKLKVSFPQRDDVKFEAFLKEVKPLFSDADWPYAKLDIAEEYFYKLQKDHKTFFKYAAANYNDDDNKIRYMSMYLYGSTVDDEEKKLFAEWMKLVVKEASGYEVLIAATRIMNAKNDKSSAKQYATWGLKKAQILNKDGAYFRKVLDQTS